MRLGNQGIGPHIQNLEQFRNVETIQLHNNLITEISGQSFQGNPKLQFIALQKNQITCIQNLVHLESLQFLDLSNNLIEVVDETELPPNLLALKLIGNPVHAKAKGALSQYRKPIVLHLEHLEDLDKIEILPAERLTYQGVIKAKNAADKRLNIDEMLVRQMANNELKKKGLKVQDEVR